ncbi:hypothetical protein D4R42_00230 [bacterium]|nr:MAG: hypothetical protein D4R42_00230 [bacterium]
MGKNMPTEKQKKSYKVKPKEIHKKAFDKSLENGGNISKAMKEVGYSKATSKNPKRLTETKGWKQLMDEYLPDTLLAEKHEELLKIRKKTKRIRKGETIKETEELDTNAIKAGLDMAYKLKGHYAAERQKIEHSGEILGDEGIHPEDEELRLEYKRKRIENIRKRAKEKSNEHS